MKPRDDAERVRRSVRQAYGRIAMDAMNCGCGCGPKLAATADQEVPSGADMGLGSGDPLADAGLAPGETVLDLGSGGGVDCFRAARQVGESGRVIGIDMTPEMVDKARRLAAETGFANVEFRLGKIERLPVADGAADVVISNCVVNLSPDKAAVYGEAFRALRPGGRLAVSDVVAAAELDDAVRADLALHAACIGGAETAARIEAMLEDAGFEEVRIEPRGEPGADHPVFPAAIAAVKPAH
jgi:SAM-dependent methyltransferase